MSSRVKTAVFLVWIFKDTNCTLQRISRKMQRIFFIFFSPRSPTRFQSHSLCSLPQPNRAQDTSYLTTLPSSPDINPHRCTAAAHNHTLKRNVAYSTVLVNTNTIHSPGPPLQNVSHTENYNEKENQSATKTIFNVRGPFLGRCLFLSFILFRARNGAFMKMPER